MTLNNETLKLIAPGIQRVWFEIAPDVGPCTAREAAELALDAGRLGEVDPDAEYFVDQLIKEHGYVTTLRFIANNCF